MCLLLFFFKMRKDGPTYNVQSVWNMGFTGKGVVVAVVDEGIEKNHPELKQNFVSVLLVNLLLGLLAYPYTIHLAYPIRCM